MLVDFIQFLIFGLPLLILWHQGKLRATLELPAPSPLVHNWRGVMFVLLCLTLYLVFGWTSYIAEVGWDMMLKTQGALL